MKKLFLMLTFGLPTPPTYSIQQPANLKPNEHIVYQLVDTAYWAIATTSVGLGLQKAITLYHETALLEQAKCFNPNQNVLNFITTELQKITGQQIAIKIHPLYSCSYPIASLKKHILIAQSVADEISNALETNDETTLNKWRGVLHHEVAHIHNNDIFWRATTEITLPFIMHGIGKVIYYALSMDKQNNSFTMQQVQKLIIGASIWAYVKLTRMAFCRYQEQRADNTIRNNPDLLNGMKTFLNDIETLSRNNLKHLTDKQYKLNRWLNNLAEEHPLNEKRIEKLEKRIAYLEC